MSAADRPASVHELTTADEPQTADELETADELQMLDELEFLLDADPAECARRATHQAAIAQAAGNDNYEMRLSYYAGFAHHLLGEDEAALAAARRTETLALAGGDLVWRSRALACRGLVHHELGDIEDAVDLLRRAVALRREAHDEAGTAENLNSLGMVYSGIVQLEPEAARVLTEARRLWLQAGDSDRAAVALTNLARTYVATSTRIAKTNRRGATAAARFALQTAQQAVDEADAAGLSRTAVSARLAVVGAQLVLGDLVAAGAVLDTAGRMVELFPAGRQQLALLRARAQWLVASRRFGDAIVAAEAGLATSEGRPAERTELLRTLVESHEGAGDAVSALRRLHELHDLTTELNESVAERRAVLLGSRLEIERAERAAESERRRAQALEVRNARLAHEAMHDALTGLANRRALDATLEAWAEGGVRTFAVAILDIDHFKAVNDTWSHQVGDQVLTRLGATLRAAVRDLDLAARYGGEEFALLLADASPAAAERVCERVRMAVGGLDWGDLMPGQRITVSIGLADSAGGCSVASLLTRADTALYRAKTEGRNRVCVAPAG